MDKKDDNSPSNLWARRSNTNKSLSSTTKPDREHHDAPSVKRFGSFSSRQNNPFNNVSNINTHAVTSPGGASFGLGSGAFASFGSASKTPKTPGSAFDFGKVGGGGVVVGGGSSGGAEKKDQASDREDREKRIPGRKSQSSLRPSTASAEAPPTTAKDLTASWPLKNGWVIHYRPPSSKNSDYEKSIQPLFRVPTAQAFWQVYSHLKRPSQLPSVSDYHFFKEGIRPVWEDEENRKGGKWTMRLKKGVADRYWEDLLLALVGDQFAEASEEVCGAVVSVRSGEDVFSIWTKNDGGRNVKIRETLKRVLALPPDTVLVWRSHDESITQRNAVDQARQEKSTYSAGGEKRRNTLVSQDKENKKEDLKA